MDTQSLLQQKPFLFWLLQVIGFTGYGLINYLPKIYLKEIHVPEYYSVYIILVCAAGIVVTLGLRLLYRYTWDMGSIWRIAGFIAGSIVASIVWNIIRFQLFGIVISSQEESTFYEVLVYSLSDFWVMAGWTGLYVGIKYYLLLQEEREQRLKLAAMAHEAQLKMLRYQLNPHFLFNTLNAISTLILDRNNTLAGTMVTRLSNFLRYSLDNDPIQKVSLEQEIEALKLYLGIEKVRFDERLQVRFNISERVVNAQVPSLLLQPLVENAIKYAITQVEDGGTITINAYDEGGKLVLEVIDDGPGFAANEKNKGTGVGLRNTANRLRELYGDDQVFQLDQVQPHGLRITIRIPLELVQELNVAPSAAGI